MSPDHAAPTEGHPLCPWLTPGRRAYVYRLATVLLVAAGGAGLVDAGRVADILAVLAAVLAVPVAALHTPRGS